MNKQKNYCGKCGRILDKKYINMHYNILTGEQEHDIFWKCPKKRWYNSHTQLKSDKNGNTYAYEI